MREAFDLIIVYGGLSPKGRCSPRRIGCGVPYSFCWSSPRPPTMSCRACAAPASLDGAPRSTSSTSGGSGTRRRRRAAGTVSRLDPGSAGIQGRVRHPDHEDVLLRRRVLAPQGYGRADSGVPRSRPPDTTLVLMGYDLRRGVPDGAPGVRVVVSPEHQVVLDAMCEADLYVMNSRSEGFGVVLLEAMLNRTPWAARDIAGAHDLSDYGTVYATYEDLVRLLASFTPDPAQVARARNGSSPTISSSTRSMTSNPCSGDGLAARRARGLLPHRALLRHDVLLQPDRLLVGGRASPPLRVLFGEPPRPDTVPARRRRLSIPSSSPPISTSMSAPADPVDVPWNMRRPGTSAPSARARTSSC